MPTTDKLIEQLDFLSDLLSNRVRTISGAILALAWLFLSGGSSSPVLPAKPDTELLLISGGLAITVLICDYLQYLFGYVQTKQVFKQAEKSAGKAANFHSKAFTYRARQLFFGLKQLFMVVALGFLAKAIFDAVF
jgi:hypothetical protein